MSSNPTNNLAQDLCLLAEGKYGKITDWNTVQVAHRIIALILYHSGQSQHVLIPRALSFELVVRALNRDLPELAERMKVDLLMAASFDLTDQEELDGYQHSLLNSILNNLNAETIGLKTDKGFFEFDRLYQAANFPQ